VRGVPCHENGDICIIIIIVVVVVVVFVVFKYIFSIPLYLDLNLIKLIKPSNTTPGVSQVTRYSVKLPGRHGSVCRNHHHDDGRDRPKHVVLVILQNIL